MKDSSSPSIHTLSLTGNSWRVKKARSSNWIPASVPGDVVADLLAAKEIPDPFYRDNEKELQWIGESDWTYRRTFKVPADLLKKKRVLLRCEGLDTLATLVINGKTVATTDNMYRGWEFDVREVLKVGTNTISVTFASAQKYIDQKGEELFLHAGNGDNVGHIRKEPCNFGWDWGIKLVTCGIWRNIQLVAFDLARLSDVRVVQDHSKKGRVGLGIETTAEKTGRRKLSARVTVSLDGKTVASEEGSFSGKSTVLETVVKNPRLWWPNNLGDQPLYTVTVELLDAEGNPAGHDSQTDRAAHPGAGPSSGSMGGILSVRGEWRSVFRQRCELDSRRCGSGPDDPGALFSAGAGCGGGQHEHAPGLGRRDLRGRGLL